VGKPARRGLAAQEETASWASDTAIAGIAAALFALFNLFLIWKTLRYTRDSAEHALGMLEEARKATSTAQVTVEATKSIGAAEIRAYFVSAKKKLKNPSAMKRATRLHYGLRLKMWERHQHWWKDLL